MSHGVVLCGYHRRGSWPVSLKKAQVKRRTAGCRKGWTPEAARKVDRSSVVMARAESQERNAVRWKWKRGQWSRKYLVVSGVVLHQGQKGAGDRRRQCK
ncbi:hypothetical protein E2C01_095767 [Portunus trituberculatus]|uniref:Uncharacterized protein n=1 Tax=Portunus trituberculatus TaxID=210409 RepID=A0A5B7K113_PORTR|nr:hypothetical protein [Portunus trituberculatus]